MQAVIVILLWAALAIIMAAVARGQLARGQARRRLWETGEGVPDDDAPADALDRGWFARWLYLAGFRRPTAMLRFVVANMAAVALGAAVAVMISRSGVLKAAQASAAAMPGGIGSLAQPVLQIAPWLLLLMFAALPMSIVRGARRRRVAEVERDLPITLELLATLAESGIGFDAGTRRILDSQPADRVLASELRTLQTDLLAGRSRVDCLRRFARRLDVISATIFISAIVQAEQIGSGVAAVLRQQADDLRQRRRERALEFSMALPVKQLFPLVICFLPAILIFAIGPLFAEFLKYTNSFGGFGRQ